MSEWLTDKEKRILLSALSREKEICIKVDKECCREPYETNLEDVCKSLERKFYYDRLFKQMEKQIRNDAIDEFIKKCKATHDGLICNWDKPYGITFERMEEKAKELKEGKE